MPLVDLGRQINTDYEIHEWRHASAVLKAEFPAEWDDLVYVLTQFRLLRSYIAKPGGNKSLVANRIDGLFRSRDWEKKKFDIKITIDKAQHPSPTHEIDNFKNHIAQETEWNNKDPFFDRDLNNFRLLHQLGVVSVGIIVTRASELQGIFDDLGRGKSYGQATTHMDKLLPKMEGGGAGGCPVLAFGIRRSLYDPTQ